MAASILESWRLHRQWRRSKAEARQLVGEASRILKKKRYRIPESVSTLVRASIDEVEASRKGDDLGRMRQALADLDGKMDEHLAFARKSSVRQYVESIGLALGVALLLRAFVIEAFQIPSGSMIPTLAVGDHIFVSKFSYAVGVPFTNTKIVNLDKPKRGDVIVFKYPPDQSVDYIKRVVGLPGETVEVRRNEVFIDGRPMSRELSAEPCAADEESSVDDMPVQRPCEAWVEHLDGRTHMAYQDPRFGPSNYGPVTVPQGHYFAMGDNRDNSKDSRVWGFVPFELIKGRALIVWWSRDPGRGGLSPSGLVDWFRSIRWARFFKKVE